MPEAATTGIHRADKFSFAAANVAATQTPRSALRSVQRTLLSAEPKDILCLRPGSFDNAMLAN